MNNKHIRILVILLTFFSSTVSYSQHLFTGSHSAVLCAEGSMMTYGYNAFGQLGTGSTFMSDPFPAFVDSLTDISSIFSGGANSFARMNDGTLWSWGNNNSGILGDGTSTHRYTPVKVHASDGTGYFTNAAELACSGMHTMVLKSDGTVWAWGDNIRGELGTGEDSIAPVHYLPEQVKGIDGIGYLTDIAHIAAGSSQFSLAVTNDGSVMGWGYGTGGVLCDEVNLSVYHYYPLILPALSDINDIATGGGFAAALKNDGTLWTWGLNTYGQLGVDTTFKRSMPGQVEGISDIISVECGTHFILMLKSDGTVWAMGNNTAGQLGDGTIENRYTPVQVTGLSNIVEICAGGNNSMALQSDGTLWAWGSNYFGEIGNGIVLNEYWSPLKIETICSMSTVVSLPDEIAGTPKIFPNPAQDFIIVPAGNNLTFSIADMTGRILIENSFDYETEKIVNIVSLASGIYVIRFYDTNTNSFTALKFEKI